MNDEIEIPATVAAFLKEPAIRSAVEALLEIEDDKLPPGLTFDELDTYYLARGGAELTRHDMAHVLRQLWSRIWARHIGQHWQAASLEEMVDEGFAVTPDQIWDERSFTVYHRRTPYVLYTDVTLQPQVLRIAFSVEHEEEEEVLISDHFEPFRWHDDDTWQGWQVVSLNFESKGVLPDLTPLVQAAALACSASDAAVAAREALR